MSLSRAITIGISVCLGTLLAQDCPAVARVLPNGTLSGALDAGSCQLTDRTPYNPYRLDLPVRGQLKIELSGGSADSSVTLRDAAATKVDAGASLLRHVEAGSYTLLVTGSASGVSYTVKTSFASEPGILCANFPSIGRSQTVPGNFSGAGCVAPDGTPYDAYTVASDGSGTLTVTAASQDFTPLIAVRSIDGHPLTVPSASPVLVLVENDSQYLIVITSADQSTGAYEIANTFQTADGETCVSQKTLAAPDVASANDSGAITADSCFVTMPDSGDPAYYNYYDFTLSSGGLVSASAASGDFAARLSVLDAGGNTLATDTGGGSDAQDHVQYSVQSSLRVQLPAGSYRLRISTDLPSGGSYTLKYAFQAGNPQPCGTGVLAFGSLLNGAVSDASCRSSLGASDLYTLTVPAAGTVDLEIDSGAFDTFLAIRDSKDNLIVRDDAVNGLRVAHITAALPAGVYTVIGGAVSGSGSYQLSAKFTALDLPPCTFAQVLELNGGFIQRLGSRSCTGSNGQPVDYYTFTLPADALVLAVMTSSELNGYLTLYDASGAVLRNDDNTYGSGDPLIVQYLPAGSYKLAAREASSSVGGLYEVDLRTVTGPRPALCTQKATVAPGGSVTGTITFTGCQYTDNTFADLYRMDLAADSAVDLALHSSEFDAYLIVLDSTGAAIDEDDDSGGGTDARIARDLAAGTYFVVVKPFGDYLSHGAYTLTAK